jgi:hypothetical protein
MSDSNHQHSSPFEAESKAESNAEPYDPLKTIRPLDRVFTDEAEKLRARMALVDAEILKQRLGARERAKRAMMEAEADTDDETRAAERTANMEREKELARKVFMDHLEKAQELIQLLKDRKNPTSSKEAMAKIREALGNPVDPERETLRINAMLMRGVTAMDVLYKKELVTFKSTQSNVHAYRALVQECKLLNRLRIHLMTEREIATLDNLLQNIIPRR